MRPNDNNYHPVMSLLAFLVFTASNYTVRPVTCLGPGVNYFFKTLHHKDLPTSVDPYATRTVRSLSLCTALCARDDTCKSVYYASSSSPGQSVTCSLMSEEVSHSSFSPGEGTYAYLNTIVTADDPPPALSRGTHLYNRRHGGGLVAVYDFGSSSHSLDKVGVTYDAANEKWPRVTGPCADKLYLFKGFRATVVTITDVTSSGTSYEIRAHCHAETETNPGHAECHGSDGWAMSGDVGVACLSTTCYRLNAQSKAQYAGTARHTRYGTGCHLWSKGYLSGSYFPLDGYSISAASKYCRDPYGYGRPWCYFYPYYDYCNVPRCSWESIVDQK